MIKISHRKTAVASLLILGGLVGGVYADTLQEQCRSGQSCSGTGDSRVCRITNHCWFTLHRTMGIYTDPEGAVSGINLPATGFDGNSDAVMDCWKGVTTDARLTSGFPYRNNGVDKHDGIDVTSDSGNEGHGAPIKSLGAGVVTEVTPNHSLNGNFVRIRQGDGVVATYIHLLDFQKADGTVLQEGETVWPGTQIGRMNCTGNCGGAVGEPTRGDIEWTHVHIQIRRSSDGALLDPVDMYGGETCSIDSGSTGSTGGGTGGGGIGGGTTGTCSGTICSNEP